MFADRIRMEIEKLGGEIKLNTEIKSIADLAVGKFDKVLVTLPSPIFGKIAKLPQNYTDKITSIPHLHAQVLILTLKKSFMNKTYWLNITQKDFPFLVLAEHTNFMDKKYYGNEHILYIGNYLPTDHPFLKMNKSELLKKFMPYLKKINPKFDITGSYLFLGPFAQPVVKIDYPKLISQLLKENWTTFLHLYCSTLLVVTLYVLFQIWSTTKGKFMSILLHLEVLLWKENLMGILVSGHSRAGK